MPPIYFTRGEKSEVGDRLTSLIEEPWGEGRPCDSWMATLSLTKGTVKDTQGVLRHERLPTTVDVYMQVMPEGVKQMIDSMYDELRNRKEKPIIN